MATEGVILKSIGELSASAQPKISNSPFNPFSIHAYSLINSKIHEPSLSLLAFAAVIVPNLFLSGNTGFNFDTLSFLNFNGSSSYFIIYPFTSTPIISFANIPFSSANFALS